MMGPRFECLVDVLPSEYHDIVVNNIGLVRRFSEVYDRFTLEQLYTSTQQLPPM